MRLARLIEFFADRRGPCGRLILWALVRLSDAMLGCGAARAAAAVAARRAGASHGARGRLQHAVAWRAVALLGAEPRRVRSPSADPSSSGSRRCSGTPVGWGAVSVSLGDLLAFGDRRLAHVPALASRCARCSQEDVFSRVEVGRGVAAALSSLAHYLILLLGIPPRTRRPRHRSHPHHDHRRRARRRHRLRSPERGEQLRLWADPALRAARSRWATRCSSAR